MHINVYIISFTNALLFSVPYMHRFFFAIRLLVLYLFFYNILYKSTIRRRMYCIALHCILAVWLVTLSGTNVWPEIFVLGERVWFFCATWYWISASFRLKKKSKKISTPPAAATTKITMRWLCDVAMYVCKCEGNLLWCNIRRHTHYMRSFVAIATLTNEYLIFATKLAWKHDWLFCCYYYCWFFFFSFFFFCFVVDIFFRYVYVWDSMLCWLF